MCRSLHLAPIAYCLLPPASCLLQHHYHWLMRQEGQQPAGWLPQRVFEGNYRVKPVEVQSGALHLIHANPAIHGLADDVAGWPYSNYLEWVGEREGTLVEGEFVRAHFPAAGEYRAFVAECIAQCAGGVPENLGKLSARSAIRCNAPPRCVAPVEGSRTPAALPSFPPA